VSTGRRDNNLQAAGATTVLRNGQERGTEAGNSSVQITCNADREGHDGVPFATEEQSTDSVRVAVGDGADK